MNCVERFIAYGGVLELPGERTENTDIGSTKKMKVGENLWE